jgi:uncharacterized membrane protein
MLPKETSLILALCWACFTAPWLIAQDEPDPQAVAPVVEEVGPEAAFDKQAIELAPEILKIFERSCRECHDSSVKKPKGGFGFVMDLARMREDPDYIVPGDAEDSEIYLLIIDPDDEFVMPPPESDFPSLTQEEKEMVKDWINGGAPPVIEQETELEPAADAPEETGPAEPEETGDPLMVEEDGEKVFSLSNFFARTHPLLVHFPIALLMLGLFAEAVRQVRPKDHLEVVVGWCLWFGMLGALFSAASGWLNVDVAGWSDEKIFKHRWSGVAVAVLSVVCAVMHPIVLRWDKKPIRITFWILLLLTGIAVSIAGHTGGELIYGENYLWP